MTGSGRLAPVPSRAEAKMSRIRRALGALGVGVGAAALALVGWVGWTFRGGEPFPDRSGPPRLGDAALELVVSHPEPIGNVAVAADGLLCFARRWLGQSAPDCQGRDCQCDETS